MNKLKGTPIRSRSVVYTVFFAVLVLLLSLLIFSVARAQDDGAGGGGGTGSGCVGTYCTDNGFGWRKYSIDGSGPGGNSGRGFVLNSPKTWSEVKDICKGYDTESVWIFVALHSSNGLTVGLNFDQSKYDQGYIDRLYRGDESIAQVKQYYDEASSRGISGVAGLSWGTDIGWFCYSSNPPWHLVTKVSVDKQYAEVGSRITWTHTVTNKGDNKTNKVVTWHPQDRGDWPNNPGTDWTIAKGLQPNDGETKTSSYVVQSSDFGKLLCRATSAQPASNTDSWWTESDRACVRIVKKPKAQILGADLIVGRGSAYNSARSSQVNASVSTLSNGLVYGSWSEYGILATSTVSGMASGSGYAFGAGTNSLCSLSPLTFVNSVNGACSNSSIGNYSQLGVAPNVAQRYPVRDDTPKLGLIADIRGNDLKGVYTSNEPTLQLGTSDGIEKGRWVVINAPSTDVTITSDIRYSTESFAQLSEIPQVVIIAKNIFIKDSVQGIDAWLVATGTKDDGKINTCAAGAVGENTALTRGMCATQLTINGPVMANHLVLRRTHGSDSLANAAVAAEIINLRGDTYLWATGNNRGLTVIRTMSTKELPPRY